MVIDKNRNFDIDVITFSHQHHIGCCLTRGDDNKLESDMFAYEALYLGILVASSHLLDR